MAFERKARAHALSKCNKNKKIAKRSKNNVSCTVEGCSVVFKLKKQLKKHFKDCHPEMTPQYTCSVCGRVFSDI